MPFLVFFPPNYSRSFFASIFLVPVIHVLGVIPWNCAIACCGRKLYNISSMSSNPIIWNTSTWTYSRKVCFVSTIESVYKDTRNRSLALMTVSISASGVLDTATTFCISPLIVKLFRNFILSCLYRTEEVSHPLIPPFIETRFNYCSVNCTHWQIKHQGGVSSF